MNVDHEDLPKTVYKAEITVSLSYGEALLLIKQISQATRAYQHEMENIEANESNEMDHDYPDYVKKDLLILREFKEILSEEVDLIEECGKEDTPVDEED